MQRNRHLAIAASLAALLGATAAAPSASADEPVVCLASAGSCDWPPPGPDCSGLSDDDMAAWDAYLYDGAPLPERLWSYDLGDCFGF